MWRHGGYCREMDMPGLSSIDLGDFACPRCGGATSATYYGPCQSCRDELRAVMQTAQADGEAPAYEPKMNVTPNAVALKE